jgi:hypothetical protein
MRRIAASLRTDRPVPDDPTPPQSWDGDSWGFTALDGLPDLEEASGYTPAPRPRIRSRWPSPDILASGYGQELRDELAELFRGTTGHRADGQGRSLTAYEIEVLDSLFERRDAALRLQMVLADDLAQFEDSAACVRDGRAIGFLDRSVGGSARRTVTDAVAEFEAARHRTRVALVAVGVDNGMSGAEIGQALSFSRQLASRYLAEARAKWPCLQQPATRRGRRN